MKRSVLIAVFSVATSILIIAGCSKKNDAQSYTVQQLTGTYKLTASTSAAMGQTHDNMQDLDACEKDDLMKLNADSTIQFIDAGTQCGNGDYSANFIVKGNLLIQSPDNYPDSATIKSFNGSSLVLTTTEVEQGISVLTTVTFAKQ